MDKQLDIRGDKVADVLLAEGKVTRGQLDEARRIQIQDHRDLSDILLSLATSAGRSGQGAGQEAPPQVRRDHRE